MGRGVIIALAVSMGVNFFVAGFLLHDRIDREPPPPPAHTELRGFDNPGRLMRFAGALPPDSRREFRAAIRVRLPDMRAQHREIRKSRDELRVLIESERWDGDAVKAKMDEIRTLREKQLATFDTAFADALGVLSAEERRFLVETAQERQNERRGRRRFKGE